ncbi:MAG: SAM-dependent methyltransferase [Aquificaceae bacterium]
MASGIICFKDWMEEKVREYYEADFRKDFFTAPELDRSFGYALAYHIAQFIRDYPKPVIFELGGGSGALAFDILTYLREKEGKLFERLRYYIYDFSPKLISLQKERLKDFKEKVHWAEGLFPMEGVIFSNEFFDCLPVHVIRNGKELFINDGEELWLDISKEELREVIKRMGYENLPQIVEISMDWLAFLKKIGESLLKGFHIVIDYGYTTKEMGKFPEGTVVGYKNHRLHQKPSEGMDITAHVNFSILEEYGRDFGLEKVAFLNLKDFLLQSPPFLEELESLSLSDSPEDIERLSRLKTLLISMGYRFKVLIQKKLQGS